MPDFIQASCVACLSCEAVGERLGKVVSVPHPGGRVPQGDSGCIQQARVGVSQNVIAHPLPVEGAEGSDELLERWSVGTAYWKIELGDYLEGALAQWNDAKALSGLRGVHSPAPVAGAPDTEEMAVYVSWLDGDYLPPTEARQQDEFRHLPMHPRHTLDDVAENLTVEVEDA